MSAIWDRSVQRGRASCPPKRPKPPPAQAHATSPSSLLASQARFSSRLRYIRTCVVHLLEAPAAIVPRLRRQRLPMADLRTSGEEKGRAHAYWKGLLRAVMM